VSEARNILTSDLEWQATSKNKLRYLQHMWEGVSINTFTMKNSEYGPQYRSFDLFGDESIIFAHTPGHSHGLVSTIVQRDGQFLLLANDTGYAKKSWEEMILPGIVVSKQFLFRKLQEEFMPKKVTFKNIEEAIADFVLYGILENKETTTQR
jgi:hypothetical protein